MKLWIKIKKFSQRKKIILGLTLLTIICGLIILVWAILTHRIQPQAASNQMSSMATLTFRDQFGTNYKINSNEALVDIEMTNSTTIIFNLNLQGKTSDQLKANDISMQIYPPGQKTPSFTQNNLTTNDSGKIILTSINLAPGKYDIVVKVPTYLSKKNTNVDITSGLTPIQLGTMLAGDLNGDNTVNQYDWPKMAVSWLKKQGDADYNPQADFYQDGEVNHFDWSYIASNWLKVGD